MGQAEVDLGYLKSIFGDDEESLNQILSVFLSDSTSLIEGIEQAINSDDFTNLKRLSHGLKGISSSVGLHAISTQAAQLEDLTHQPRADEIVLLYKSIKADFKSVEAQLRSLIS